MINKSILIGRLTRDPELRRTAQGTAVTSFTIAIDRGFNTNDGQSADFIHCVCWKKQAENVAEYCHKGSLVGVDGSLRSRTYDNSQGKKVFVVEVLANFVQFLEPEKHETNNAPVNNNDFYEMLPNDGVDWDNDPPF